MARSRYQINAEVRRVFARHWVDIDRLNFGFHRGILRVTGELYLLRQEDRERSKSIVEVLQGELLRHPEVKRVLFELANWVRDARGFWAPKKKAIDDTDDTKHARVAVRGKQGGTEP